MKKKAELVGILWQLKTIDYFGVKLQIPTWTKYVFTDNLGVVFCTEAKPYSCKETGVWDWELSIDKKWEATHRVKLNFNYRDSLIRVK